MSNVPLKPAHKSVNDHYAALAQFQLHGHTTEGNTRADGVLIDTPTVVHGVWGAKDEDDDLSKEIKSDMAAGDHLDSILFRSPSHPVLYSHTFSVTIRYTEVSRSTWKATLRHKRKTI